MTAAGIAIENVCQRPHDGMYALGLPKGQIVFGPQGRTWFASWDDNGQIAGEVTSNQAAVLKWVAEHQS